MLCPLGQILRLQSSLKISSESHKTGAGQALECIDLVWDGSSKEHGSQNGQPGAARAPVGYLNWPKGSRTTLILREKEKSGLVKMCRCTQHVSCGCFMWVLSCLCLNFPHKVFSLHVLSFPLLNSLLSFSQFSYFSLSSVLCLFHCLCPLIEFSYSFLPCTACQILHLCINFCSYSFTTYSLRFLLTVFPSTGYSTVIYPHSFKSQSDLTLQP